MNGINALLLSLQWDDLLTIHQPKLHFDGMVCTIHACTFEFIYWLKPPGVSHPFKRRPEKPNELVGVTFYMTNIINMCSC